MREVIIEFPVPGDYLTANKLPSTPWGAKNHRATKNLWYEAAFWGAVEAFPGTGPSGREMPPSDVFISFPVWGQRNRDADNWFLTAKPIIDGLREAGLWPDDNTDWVTPHVGFRVVQKKEDFVKEKVIVRVVERDG